MLVCDGLRACPKQLDRLAGHDRPDLRGPPPAELVPLCRPPGLGQDRQGSQAIYTAATEDAALERFAAFADTWGNKYPAIVRLWQNAWEEFTPFLRFDTEIR